MLAFAAASLLALAAAPASAAPLCKGCPIVFVSFDATQASHVRSLGYERETTPVFDELARRGALFTQAVSPASWTVPTGLSWFTGTYPSVHKVTNKFSEFTAEKQVIANLRKLSPELKTLAEVLRENGYATGGFTCDAGVNGVFGYSLGFDVYFDSVPPFSPMDHSIPRALAWLKTAKDRPYFLFLHGYGNHGQSSPTGGFDRRYVDAGYAGPYDGSPAQQRELREKGLAGEIDMAEADVRFWRAIYDEKIARTDALFGQFLEVMAQIGADRRVVFVLVSDHGTEFYEHRKFDHGATLYDELVHVPLAIVVPGAAPRVVREQVTTMDLMPTLLEIVGVEPSPELRAQMRGRSLVPALRGEAFSARDVFFETDYRLFTHKRGVRSADGWKLIYTLESEGLELYDLKTDPGETKNLAKADAAKTLELLDKVRAHYRELGASLTSFRMGCSPVYADQCK